MLVMSQSTGLFRLDPNALRALCAVTGSRWIAFSADPGREPIIVKRSALRTAIGHAIKRAKELRKQAKQGIINRSHSDAAPQAWIERVSGWSWVVCVSWGVGLFRFIGQHVLTTAKAMRRKGVTGVPAEALGAVHPLFQQKEAA